MCAQNPVMKKSVRGYFENLVEECIQEVSTMEYFRGNSHIVSVEDYKVMEYLDEIGWDILSAWNISQASWNIMREKISQKKK